MKNNIGLIFLLLLIVVCIFLSIVITKAIVNADIPLWLKIWLLKS